MAESGRTYWLLERLNIARSDAYIVPSSFSPRLRKFGPPNRGEQMAMTTHSAGEVAKYFLASVDPDENDLSNLKLQKLCYYAQGILTVMRRQPLFREKIFAWDHGPVVSDLYHHYKDNRNQPIPLVEDFDVTIFDKRDRTALDDILEYYGQFSPWRLAFD